MIFFVNDILKSESQKTECTNIKLFPGLELKFQVFPIFEQISGIFQAWKSI